MRRQSLVETIDILYQLPLKICVHIVAAIVKNLWLQLLIRSIPNKKTSSNNDKIFVFTFARNVNIFYFGYYSQQS